MKDDTPFILECPGCRTRYELPVSIPDGGRKVRCANCSYIWVARPQDAFRKGEEPPVEDPPVQEVVFREGEDAPGDGDPSPEEQDDDPEPAEDAASGIDAESGGDEMAASGSEEPEADRPGPTNFAAAVAETTGAFSPVGVEDRSGVEDADGNSPSADIAADADFAPPDADAAPEEKTAAEDEPARSEEDSQADVVADFYGDGAAPEDEQAKPSARAAPKRPMRRKQGGRRGLAAGWVFLLLAVGAIAYIAVTQRVEIVRLMPGSAPLYAAVGLPVNVRGLDFRDVAYSWETDGGQVVLEVHGDIVNLTSQPLEVPALVLGLRDESDTEIYQWEEAVMNAPLGAGDSATFAVRIPTPPTSIKSVQVRFARGR